MDADARPATQATDTTPEQRPALSVVIPMYNEAERLGATMDDTLRWIRGDGAAHGQTEVILVDDGSTDGTLRVARDWQRRAPCVVRIEQHEQNRGKGAAVRTGLGASRGAWVLMMDADNSARAAEVGKLLERAGQNGAALVAGSRAAKGCNVRTKAVRRLSGLIFRLALASLGMGLLRDTQCGFKLYRADLARVLAATSTEDGFVFDLEHLLLAKRAGGRIEEVGIEWRHMDGGSVRVGSDGPKMLRQAWALRSKLGNVRVPELGVATGATAGAASVVEPKPEHKPESKPERIGGAA